MAYKQYESVVIINAALEDDQIDSLVKNISALITDNGGQIKDLDLWGRKRLAYPIQKSKSGYYAIYRFVSPPEFISKLERMYKLDENVIRHLTVALDKKALNHFAKLEAEKEEAQKVTVTEEVAKEEKVEVSEKAEAKEESKSETDNK